VNPYQLTQYLLKKLQKNGVRIFDLTEVEGWEPRRQHVELRTTTGLSIIAKYLIVACGYESQNYLPKHVTQLNSTYAIVSKPMPVTKNFWYKNALIWETKHPYLYIRTTGDNRILIGGRDEPFYNPEKRDAMLSRKRRQLEADFQKLFPNLLYQTDFAWAGTFGETKDGLPYIGSYNHPRTLFAMGYGGNGITFSVAAAYILHYIIMGKKSGDIRLFAFDR
jgi:glycine/D-amino acid oxidase-like deaminating enzyme